MQDNGSLPSRGKPLGSCCRSVEYRDASHSRRFSSSFGAARPQSCRAFLGSSQGRSRKHFPMDSLSMQTAADFQVLVKKAFDEQERGESVVFATIERSSDKVIGSTRFMNIDRANRRVEIGSTWIAPAWQRTTINTEAKYLMLRHAFEVWKC